MKALLFPGQGSQIVGMGSEFFNNFDIVKKIFNEADEALKFNLSKIILNGPDDELKLTQNTQPAIMTVSYSIFSVLKKEHNITLDQFKYFAGHSLGEYSALVSGEALNFSDAVYLLQKRGKAMQEAVPVGQGAMLAVLGCEIEELNNFIAKLESKKVCEIANDNSIGQTIISGSIESISELQSKLKETKKKSILLPVSAPFHCSLMKSAAEKMEEKINTTKFKDAKIDIISNVKALPEIEASVIKKNLIDQICSKVRWRESILFMTQNGVNEFIEIGPGKVLSGLVKRITNESKSKSINTVNDMKDIFK